MSRITLTRYDNGDDRLVVGWDHPAGGCFWQEFNQEPEPGPDGIIDWEVAEAAGWTEVVRFGGQWPGLPLDKLREDMPEDLRVHVTNGVVSLLEQHSKDPESGRIVLDWEGFRQGVNRLLRDMEAQGD
jgi:hypothetical protein